jgi:large subunit ribosomal protein L11
MRQLRGKARLIMYAGVSKPNPKLGQCLGPLGMNMMQFCKEFNEKTNYFNPDVPLRVNLTAYTDRTYEYKIKPPPTSWFLKRVAYIEQGPRYPGAYKAGEIPIKYVYELAKLKKEFDPDFKDHSMIGIVKCIIGQMKSMGILATESTEPRFSIVVPLKF